MRLNERTVWIALVLLAFLLGVLAGPEKREVNSSAEIAEDDGTMALTASMGSDGTREPITVRSARPVVLGPVPESRSPEAITAFARQTLEEPNTIKRFAALSNLLENLTPENWREVKKAFGEQTSENGRLQYQEWQMFLQRAGEVAGKPVADLLYQENRKDGIRSALTGWAISDPEAAVEWLETVPDPAFRDSVWGAAVRGVAMTDPDLALRLLEQLEVDHRASYTNNLMSLIVQTAGVEGASDVFDQAVRRAETNEELEGTYLQKIFSTLVERRLNNARLPGTEDWARKHLGQPYARNGFYYKSTEAIARRDPEAAIAWLEDAAAAGFEGGGFGAVITGWMESRGTEAIGEWLNANPDHPRRDILAGKFATKIAGEDPEAAAAWVDSIRDPAVLTEIAPLLSRENAPDPFTR